MPAGIAPADRKLLMGGGVVLVLLLAASLILAPPAEQAASTVPSTYSNQSAGARAAYLLLVQLHQPIRRWEEPPTELPDSADDVLLILADPLQSPSGKERKALRDFVEDGGRVLFTGPNLRMFFGDAQLTQSAEPEWKTLTPAIPSNFSRNAHRIALQPEAYWGQIVDTQLPLYAESSNIAVVSWKLGDGEILWWAGPTPLTNAGITHEDNLEFFLSSALSTLSNKPRRIYWDEYFHGQRSSLWSYVQKTSLAWGLLQIGLVALAILFSFSRRRGPLYAPPEVSRLSPLEFVDTLAGLYEKAGAASSALSVSYERFRSQLTRQLSLPATAHDAELGRAASQRFGWSDADLAPLLERARNYTHNPKLRPSQALQVIQELEAYASRLRIRPRSQREKN